MTVFDEHQFDLKFPYLPINETDQGWKEIKAATLGSLYIYIKCIICIYIVEASYFNLCVCVREREGLKQKPSQILSRLLLVLICHVGGRHVHKA